MISPLFFNFKILSRSESASQTASSSEGLTAIENGFYYDFARKTPFALEDLEKIESDAKKLVQIGNKIRNLTELGLSETVSTRLLIDAAKLIHSGLPKRLSVKVAVIEPLTDDLDVSEALTDLCNLMI